MRMIVGGLLSAALLAIAGPVFAQQVEIEAPAPVRARQPVIAPPGDHYQATRPNDADYYPNPPLVRYDPAFIEPATKKIETPTSTGRAGFAGWISPNTPVGAEQTGQRFDPGWFALGFAIEWGGPPPTPAKRAAPAR